MQAYGFHFAYRLSGGDPTIQEILAKDTATYTRGDLVALDAGELDQAATGSAALVGAVVETVSATDSTTYVKVIVDADAVYAVYDANARVIGATLDIDGTAGAMTVKASTNADLTVMQTSTADEPTYVMITHGEHFSN